MPTPTGSPWPSDPVAVRPTAAAGVGCPSSRLPSLRKVSSSSSSMAPAALYSGVQQRRGVALGEDRGGRCRGGRGGRSRSADGWPAVRPSGRRRTSTRSDARTRRRPRRAPLSTRNCWPSSASSACALPEVRQCSRPPSICGCSGAVGGLRAPGNRASSGDAVSSGTDQERTRPSWTAWRGSTASSSQSAATRTPVARHRQQVVAAGDRPAERPGQRYAERVGGGLDAAQVHDEAQVVVPVGAPLPDAEEAATLRPATLPCR